MSHLGVCCVGKVSSIRPESEFAVKWIAFERVHHRLEIVVLLASIDIKCKSRVTGLVYDIKGTDG
jgi:hypothetical protein